MMTSITSAAAALAQHAAMPLPPPEIEDAPQQL